MKTLKKDGRTLKPEDIYLDLSKLSEEEIKNIPYILKRNKERISFYVIEMLASNKLLSVYFANDYGLWTVAQKSSLTELAEISYPEFLQMFGESELTELPEKWFMRGGAELSEYFKSIGANLSGDWVYKGYFFNGKLFECKLLAELKDYTEITVADYKRLAQESEKTCADLGSSAQEKAENCAGSAENAEVEEILDFWNNEITEKEVELFLESKGLRAISKDDFNFPKAPEGEFPDLSGFEGPLMNVYDGDGEERDLRVIAKYTDDSLGYHFISEVI